MEVIMKMAVGTDKNTERKLKAEQADPGIKVDLMDDLEPERAGTLYYEMALQCKRLPLVPRSAVCGEQKWLMAMLDAGWTAFMSSLSVYTTKDSLPEYWNYILTGEDIKEETLAKFRQERIKDKDFAVAVLDAMEAMHQKYRLFWLKDMSMTAVTDDGVTRRLRLMTPFALQGWGRVEIFLDIFAPVLQDLTLEGKRANLIQGQYLRRVIDYVQEHETICRGELQKHLMRLEGIWGDTGLSMQQAHELVNDIWPDIEFAVE